MPTPMPDSKPTPPNALRLALHRLAAGDSLSEEAAAAAFAEVMAGGAPAASVGGLLLAMRTRGETAAEIAGAVRALRGAMRRVETPMQSRLVDTCGTGGGVISTLNLSTAAAFVVAGAGIPVAKHGNRSFTSRSGSADVLEALGISLELEPTQAADLLDRTGLVFLFAPLYHPAMRHIAAVRRELGVPTLMNLVGPLANPAGAERQVVGVSDPQRAPLLAAALARLGARHALVVHAVIGMDEISPVGETDVWEVREGAVTTWRLDPAAFGLEAADLAGLGGGEPEQNAERIESLFRSPTAAAPALRAAVLLNAAAAVYVSGRDLDWNAAVALVTESLRSGAARERLEQLRSAGR
ncbi:MAG: anthranilate phosphoribosyltransferase [Gemmatimonadota bacterium]